MASGRRPVRRSREAGVRPLRPEFEVAREAELRDILKDLDERYGHLWPPRRKAREPIVPCCLDWPGFVDNLLMYKEQRDLVDTGAASLEQRRELGRFVRDEIAVEVRFIQQECRHDHRELEDIGVEGWTPSPPALPSARKAVAGPASGRPVWTARRPVRPEAIVEARLGRMGDWRDEIADTRSVAVLG